MQAPVDEVAWKAMVLDRAQELFASPVFIGLGLANRIAVLEVALRLARARAGDVGPDRVNQGAPEECYP